MDARYAASSHSMSSSVLTQDIWCIKILKIILNKVAVLDVGKCDSSNEVTSF
jgi:hypothetical protein